MKLLINNVDYAKNILTPIKVQEVLDESLDQGVLTLTNMNLDIPFEPLTKLYLDDQIWLIGKDNVTQTRFGKDAKYRHEIGLIEETKLLEKYFVDANKTTNSLQSNEKKTLVDVVDKVLLLAETPRKGDYAIFSLNEEQRSELSLIETPEFNISGGTLREALNKVGDYIHAEVRLRNGVVYFDKYGSKENANIKKQPVAYMSVQDVEQFCSEIDGNVSNLIIDKNNDVREGTIEPYYNGYITPRTETGTVEVTENNCFIPTRHNIQDILKVEVGFLGGLEPKIGDITKYVVEKSIYDTMSSYSADNIDESKAFHIYWEKDKKGIKGLTFQLESVVGFQEYAIHNIIDEVSDLPIALADMSPLKLQFRITYVPIINIRLKQHKPYLFSTNQKSVLAYSQNDFKVDHKYYGENMKGAVSRLGNIEKTLTYIYRNDEEMPKVGTLFDKNYYISAILTEKHNKISKVSLVLSKDFNRINEYVGINNEKRFYEIPLQNVVDRNSVYEDYLIIGDYEETEAERNKRALASTSLLYGLSYKFNNQSGAFGGAFRVPVSHAIINLYDKQDNKINTNAISLPVVCFPFGNSAVFNFSFQDNYGAGDYINSFITNAKGTQDQYRYTDPFGEFEYLSFSLYGVTYLKEGSTSNNAEFLEPEDFDEAVEIGSKLPIETQIEGSQYSAPFVSTIDYYSINYDDYPLKIRKDAGESISITYQIHCVTNKENIVIGSGLAKMLNVEQYGDGNKYYEVKCYILDNEVRNLENIINELPESVSYPRVQTSQTRTLTFGNITANRSGKCIAFVNEDTKELIYAINMEVEQGKEYELPNISIRHKIRD